MKPIAASPIGVGLCVVSLLLTGLSGCTRDSQPRPLATAGIAPVYEAPLDTRRPSGARLVGPVAASRAPEGFRIRFEVSAPVDVEVAILSADGRVVRHLAAGLLGPNAPEPLQRNSLKQELVWDGKNDLGLQVAGGRLQDSSRPPPPTSPRSAKPGFATQGEAEHPQPFKIRVRIGATPRLEKVLGLRPDAISGIVAMTAGAKGELYVLTSLPGPASARRLCVLDRDGRYLRTIMPYPAKTPVERTESVGHLTIEGQRLPVVFNGHAMSLYPLIPNMPRQTMAWNAKGHLVAASAIDSAFEFGLPRHLLAFHPEGGSPEGMPFVGPELSPPAGLYRGLGRSLYDRFDSLACSPDGIFVYYTGGDTRLGADYYAQPSRHAVFRFRWDEDPHAGMEAPFYGVDSRPGHEDGYLNDPRGLATDASGHLYICDRNNDRIVVVSSGGKFLGKFAVPYPEQVAVHRRSGEIYVLSRHRAPDWLRKDHAPMLMPEYQAWRARARTRWEKTRDEPRPPTRLTKFSPWGPDAPPQEQFSLTRDFELMALDSAAEPARLWVTAGGKLERLADKGKTLDPDPVETVRSSGLVRPGHLVADPERNRVLVFDEGQLKAVALDTGRVTGFLMGLKDVDRAPDGTLYGIVGGALRRFDPEGRSLSLSPNGTNAVSVGPFRALGDPGRSLTVAPNGDIYLMRIAGEGGVQNRVDVFAADGRRKKAALVDGLGIGDAGIGVDASGNLYLGVNVKPSHARLPAVFRGKVPEANWLCWVQWTHQFRPPPWYYSMRNEYLYHYGAVMKFGPEGGTMYGRSPGAAEPFLEEQNNTKLKGAARFENGPADAPEFRSGYLYHRLRIQGAHWRFAGAGVLPASERYWGDPSCVCLYSRLDADPYGRVFVPDCFQFRVHVLDGAGNLIADVGRYGNADDQDPDVHFAWPAFVHAGADGKLYVADSLNARIVIVGFDFADQAVAELAESSGGRE